MRIPGTGRIKHVLETCAAKLSPHVYILLYHRITTLPGDPQRLAVSPKHFAQHLEIISEHFHPIHLTDIPAALKERTRNDKPCVVITFDDGYIDNLTEAKPLLTKYNIPATVFVTTASINHPHELWWDDLERLILRSSNNPDTIQLSVSGKEYTWDISKTDLDTGTWTLYEPPETKRQTAYKEITTLTRDLKPDDRMSVLEQLHEHMQEPVTPRPTQETMTENELRELVADGLIDIGAHTVNHPVLSGLTRDEQHYEIQQSKTVLEHILQREIHTFSYPYGREEDFNRTSKSIAKHCGFQLATANFPGITTRWTNPYALPRYVIGNWDSNAFKEQLLTA